MDLCSTSDVTIEPGHRTLVGTGIAIALPVGTVGLIHPRSGLAAKSGLSIVNAPGTVDAGYRGELKVCLINLDPAQPSTSAAVTESLSSWFNESNSLFSRKSSRWTTRPEEPEATVPAAVTRYSIPMRLAR